MPKSSCVPNPPNDPLVIINKWALEFCGGDHCAAALLNFFRHWHNHKLESSVKATQQNRVAQMHGDEGTQDESLLQFHSSTEIERGLLGLFGRNKIIAAIKLLESKGVIEVTSNPNPRYHFDRTKYFLFNPDICNNWIKETYSPIRQKGTIESAKKDDGRLKKGDGRLKKDDLPYNIDYYIDNHIEKGDATDLPFSRTGKEEDKRSKALATVRMVYDEKIIPAFREKTGGEYADIDSQSAITLAQFLERDVDGQSMEHRAELVVGAFGRYCDDKYWQERGLPFRAFVTQMSKYTTNGSIKKAAKRGPHTHGLQLCDDPDCTRTDEEDGLGYD